MAVNVKLGIYSRISTWTLLLVTAHRAKAAEDQRKKTRETPVIPVKPREANRICGRFSKPIQEGKETRWEGRIWPEPNDVFIFTNQQKMPMDGVVVDTVEAAVDAGEKGRKKEEGKPVDKSKVKVVEINADKGFGIRKVSLAKAFASRTALIPFLFKAFEVDALLSKK